MTARLIAALLSLSLLLAACSGGKTASVPPTFTPVPSGAGGSAPIARARPQHPVVGNTCLQGLSSYRFSGTLSLRQVSGPASAPTASSGDSGLLSGSLANLLSNVTFQGAALAPDRYQARITFGGGGVQPLDVVRVASQTFSRFGDSAWQQGDQIGGFGGISRFDPQSLCQGLLAPLDAGGQTPSRETVNGVSALRYQVSGPQVGRALRAGGREGGGREAAPAPTASAAADLPDASATVWEAEKGGYPVRFQVEGGTENPIDLVVDVTDVNGKDVRIVPPA